MVLLWDPIITELQWAVGIKRLAWLRLKEHLLIFTVIDILMLIIFQYMAQYKFTVYGNEVFYYDKGNINMRSIPWWIMKYNSKHAVKNSALMFIVAKFIANKCNVAHLTYYEKKFNMPLKT